MLVATGITYGVIMTLTKISFCLIYVRVFVVRQFM